MNQPLRKLAVTERSQLVLFIEELSEDINIAEILGHINTAFNLRVSRRTARADLRRGHV